MGKISSSVAINVTSEQYRFAHKLHELMQEMMKSEPLFDEVVAENVSGKNWLKLKSEIAGFGSFPYADRLVYAASRIFVGAGMLFEYFEERKFFEIKSNRSRVIVYGDHISEDLFAGYIYELVKEFRILKPFKFGIAYHATDFVENGFGGMAFKICQEHGIRSFSLTDWMDED